jgi:hypothetical protein
MNIEPLTPVMRRKVRAVVREPGPACEALCRIACGARYSWTLPDWLAVLAELDKCTDRVEDWLALRT